LKEVIGQPVDKKHGASSFYLTEEQYGEVMYLTTIYPQLLILQISIQTMEYIYVQVQVLWMQNNLPGYFTLCKYWASPEFIECQRSEGITEVMSLNTPTTPMDISAKLRKW
jgi:hypothetical protein